MINDFVLSNNNVALFYRDTSISYSELVEITDRFITILMKNVPNLHKANIVLIIKNKLLQSLLIISMIKCKSCFLMLDYNSQKNVLYDNKFDISLIISDVDIILPKNFTKLNINTIYNTLYVNIDYESIKKDSWIFKHKGKHALGFIMLLTSGSSGNYKCVVLPLKSVLNNATKVATYCNLNQSDKLLHSLPLHYSFGISQLLAHIISGATIIFSEYGFLPELILAEVDSHAITQYASTPYFYYKLANLLDSSSNKLHLTSLKQLMSAGGFLVPETIKKIIKHLPWIVFINNYGQTEASPRLTYKKFSKKSSDFYGVGAALPGVIIKINEHDSSGVGEILYKTKDYMLSYYGANLTSTEKKDIEYFPSGDIGYFNSSGDLVINGRKDSMIKFKGHKIYLRNIEVNILMICPELYMIKIKHEKSLDDEYLKAYLVPKNHDSFNLSDFRKKIRKNIPMHMRPTKVQVCTEFSLSANGKIKI